MNKILKKTLAIGASIVYLNLVKHDPNYPTAEYLRSVTKIGNITVK